MLKVFLSVGLAAAAQFDPPDLKLEHELHKQFKRGQMDTASPLMAKDAYLESYRLQKGENLWSLSSLLYGDGTYWPRVWAQNPGIRNPNLIRPGHTLQFVMGSEDDTPAFRITEPDLENGLELAAGQASGGTVQIPPPEIPPRPIIRIPPSFPEWQTMTKQPPLQRLDDSGLDFGRAKIADKVYLSGWVQEQEPVSIGGYLEMEKEASLPVANEYVYVKIKKGQGKVGQKYLSITPPAVLKRWNSELEDNGPIYLVQIFGEIQLTEPAKADFKSSRDTEEYDCFRALLTKSTGLNVKGFSLIPGELTMVDLTAEGPKGSVGAQIIGSQRGVSSMLYGRGDIVFLNRGAQHGLNVGQILDLYGNRTTRYTGTPVKYSPVSSGSVKIVKVTATTATAVVLSSRESIMQGDVVETSSLSPMTSGGSSDALPSSSDPDLDNLEPDPAAPASPGEVPLEDDLDSNTLDGEL